MFCPQKYNKLSKIANYICTILGERGEREGREATTDTRSLSLALSLAPLALNSHSHLSLAPLTHTSHSPLAPKKTASPDGVTIRAQPYKLIKRVPLGASAD